MLDPLLFFQLLELSRTLSFTSDSLPCLSLLSGDLLRIHIIQGVDPAEHRLILVIEELIFEVQSIVHILKGDLIAL